MRELIVIGGIEIVFDWPWMLIGGRQIDPDEVDALEQALRTDAGREYLARIREQGTPAERAAGR